MEEVMLGEEMCDAFDQFWDVEEYVAGGCYHGDRCEREESVCD
jgi:hypothetical protein